MSNEDDGPTLQVVRGNATAEEIAALVAVFATRAGPEPEPVTTTAWTDRPALLRGPVHPGPGAWRASAWPR